MSSIRWIIYEDTGIWFAAQCDATAHVAQEIDVQPDFGMHQIADSIAAHLRANGYRDEAILIALGSNRCLTATFPFVDEHSRRDVNSLAFSFEEKLPISAEEFAADFIVHPDIKSVWGVAVETTELRNLVEELEKNGVVVQSLTPLAVLALQDLLKVHKDLESDIVLWQHDQHIEFFEIHDHQPRAWRVLNLDAPDLVRQLQLSSLEGIDSPRITSISLLPELCENAQAEIHQIDESLVDHAISLGRKILTGHESNWIELRRNALAPRDRFAPIRTSVTFATWGTLCFLVIVSLAFLIRANRYENIADEYVSRQQAVFREIFPGQKIPVGVQSRLQSESTRLLGMAGQGSDVPNQSSSLVLLHHVLSCLPAEMKFHLYEIRLEKNGEVTIDGEVESHGDAGQIALALEKGGFQVEPPQSEQLGDKIVTVKIYATLTETPM